MTNWVFSPAFQSKVAALQALMKQWDQLGSWWVKGSRNNIKVIPFETIELSVKAFKIPNWFNAFTYKYIRKSKAKRSFEFAQHLKQQGIGTPEPIAYSEDFNWLGLGESYYISEHLHFDFMFRDLVERHNEFAEMDQILAQFGAFCYELHQKGIEFLDHSPGNTLIKQSSNGYAFYLVDLNRMKLHQNMSLEHRMKNLCRLTPHQFMVRAICDAYAQQSGEDADELFQILWQFTSQFQEAFYRKKRWKKRLRFWQ